MNLDLLGLIIQLTIGALVMFLGIMLWARTREPSWMVIVLSTVMLYVQIVIKALVGVRLLNLNFDEELITFFVATILDNGPQFFLALGLLLAYLAARKR